MSIDIKKLSREVSRYRPRNSFLSENPMAWTRKSILPQRFSISAKSASTLSMSATSQGTTKSDPNWAAKGSTRFFNASP